MIEACRPDYIKHGVSLGAISDHLHGCVEVSRCGDERAHREKPALVRFESADEPNPASPVM